MGKISYPMGQIVLKIEANRRLIEDASVHVILNKNSLMKNQLNVLREKHDTLYDQLYDCCAECLEKLNVNANRIPD